MVAPARNTMISFAYVELTKHGSEYTLKKQKQRRPLGEPPKLRK